VGNSYWQGKALKIRPCSRAVLGGCNCAPANSLTIILPLPNSQREPIDTQQAFSMKSVAFLSDDLGGAPTPLEHAANSSAASALKKARAGMLAAL
jgi:hypothetical protein